MLAEGFDVVAAAAAAAVLSDVNLGPLFYKLLRDLWPWRGCASQNRMGAAATSSVQSALPLAMYQKLVHAEDLCPMA